MRFVSAMNFCIYEMWIAILKWLSYSSNLVAKNERAPLQYVWLLKSIFSVIFNLKRLPDAIIEKLDRLFVDAPGITSSKAGLERIHLLSSIQSNQTLHTLILVSFNYICVSFSFLSINVKLNQTRFYNHTYWVMYSMLFWNSIIKREATLALKRTRNQSHCSFWKLLQWFIQIFCQVQQKAHLNRVHKTFVLIQSLWEAWQHLYHYL